MLQDTNAIDVSGHLIPRPSVESNEAHGVSRAHIYARAFLGDQSVDYLLRMPSRRESARRLLVAVHGIGRNPLQHMIHLSCVAERIGAVLVAPYFPKAEYPRFQRFRTRNGRLRPDVRLDRIITDVCRLAELQRPKIDLFGFSAGAQFAHRYTMAYPGNVSRAICASAGWYTLPDFNLEFPLGLRQADTNANLRFEPKAFSLVPMLVAVGDRDIRRGASLNVKPDVDRIQGRTRIDRARAWVESMNRLSQSLGNSPNVTLQFLGRCGHSLRRCVEEGGLADFVLDFLSSDLARGS